MVLKIWGHYSKKMYSNILRQSVCGGGFANRENWRPQDGHMCQKHLDVTCHEQYSFVSVPHSRWTKHLVDLLSGQNTTTDEDENFKSNALTLLNENT